MKATKGDWVFEGTPEEMKELIVEERTMTVDTTIATVDEGTRERRSYVLSGKYSKKNRRNKSWRKSEEKKLKEIYNGTRRSKKKAAIVLGRTLHSIENRLSKYGLLGKPRKPRKISTKVNTRLIWVNKRGFKLMKSEGITRKEAWKKANKEYQSMFNGIKNLSNGRRYSDGDIKLMVSELKKGTIPKVVGRMFGITGKQVCDTVKSRTGKTATEYRKGR